METSRQIDPDFELSAPMMFLKYFINADIEMKFSNMEDFYRYQENNGWLKYLISLGSVPNTQLREELFMDEFKLYFYGKDQFSLSLTASISELSYILTLF